MNGNPPGTPERKVYDAAVLTSVAGTYRTVPGLLVAMSRMRNQQDSVRLAYLDGFIDALPVGALPSELLGPVSTAPTPVPDQRLATVLETLDTLADELEESGQRYAASRVRRAAGETRGETRIGVRA